MSGAGEVLVGRIVKPHGIRGEVAVEILSDIPGRFDVGARLGSPEGPLTVEASRSHQGRMLVRFEGVATRNDAELLRGLELTADAADVSDSETYYAHELVGLPVRLEPEGRSLGTVGALIELPVQAGYDLLEVRRDDGTTWLLPTVDEYVEVVETGNGLHVAVVDPPEGLVEGEPL